MNYRPTFLSLLALATVALSCNLALADSAVSSLYFTGFEPAAVTPIIPGQPLPETIRMSGSLLSGQTVDVEFAFLDFKKPIEVTANGTKRLLATKEAQELYLALADVYVGIAGPESSAALVPVLDRLGLMSNVIPSELTSLDKEGNTQARKKEARSLGLSLSSLDLKGLSYSYVVGGPVTGETVLMIPGYPDTWHSWRKQIPALLAKGYRVVSLDLPGMGDSQGNVGIERYNHRAIVADVVTILDHLGIRRVDVVGHDWGALIAWGLSALHPDRVNKLAVITTGHPAVYSAPTTPPFGEAEAKKLWYHNFFANSFSGTPEYLMSRKGWQLFEHLMRNHPDASYWEKDFSRPGAFRAARNIYIANSNNFITPDFQTIPAVKCPVLGIMSSGDLNYLGKEQMTLSSQMVEGGRFQFEFTEGASHWTHLDRPVWVNGLLLNFFRAAPEDLK